MVTRTPAPRIGLTSYRARAQFGVWDESSDLLPAAYTDVVASAGGVALLLPPTDPALADDVLEGLHGLVITGGPDVDPSRYHAALGGHTDPPQPGRDAWELALTAAALARGLPLLGVCRGMQVMAVALGGTLCQHLPDVVGNDSHRPTLGAYGRHSVRLAQGSRLAGLLGTHAVVATHHHQAVDQLPASATATGWADDGTLEAFEVVCPSWATAVQWHPEVYEGEALFRGFLSACAAWRMEHQEQAAIR
jgi:putative glutamine amidotransferase